MIKNVPNIGCANTLKRGHRIGARTFAVQPLGGLNPAVKSLLCA